MSTCKSVRLQSAKAVAIVETVKELKDKLTLIISQDEYMNKICFHGLITDRAEKVEYAKERYMVAAEELENLTGQLESAKKRLHDINVQYNGFLEENRMIENTIQSIKSGDYLCDNERKGFSDSRLKVKLYKMMTGVYFDLNNSDELSGFVAVKGDAKQPSGLIPFTLGKEEDKFTFLWDKVGEALYKGKENMLDYTANQLEQKLKIK